MISDGETPGAQCQSDDPARRRPCDEIEVISHPEPKIGLKASEHVSRVDRLDPPAV